MAYCTVGNIKIYFLNKTFSTTDYVSEANVNEFIADDQATIDAVLRTKYSLPITNADDLVILKSINTKMVVGTIDDIYREKKEDGTFDRGRNTRKEALDMLKQIKEGTLILESAGKSSVIKFNNVRSDGETVLPRFKDKNIDEF